MPKGPIEATLRLVNRARQPVRRRKTRTVPDKWSVMLVDGASIRRKARRHYEKVLRDLDLAKAEAERFESEDKPRFAKWLNSNFGAILTEMRQLQGRLFEAQELVNEVQQEFYYGNHRSILNAYKKVLKRRQNPEELEREMKEAEQEEAEFREGFEELFGAAAEEFWEKLGLGGEAGPFADSINDNSSRARSASSRLKDLYRRLVRRLHPDKQQKRSAREIEWWHQTQSAYESGNIEQLEMILTLIEVEEKGSKEASVSVLAQLTSEFKKSLRALKRKIAGFRKDLAWNFSQLNDLSELFQRARRQLLDERDQVLWLVDKYEKQIKSWQTAATAGKRVRAHRGAWQDEEWF